MKPEIVSTQAATTSDATFEDNSYLAPCTHFCPNDDEDSTSRNIYTDSGNRQSCRHGHPAVRSSHNPRHTASISPEPARPIGYRSTTQLFHLSASRSKPITHSPRLRKYPTPPPPRTTLTTLQERADNRQRRRYTPFQLATVDRCPTIRMDEEQPPIRQHTRGPSPSSSTPSFSETVDDRYAGRLTDVPIHLQANTGKRTAVKFAVLKQKGIPV